MEVLRVFEESLKVVLRKMVGCFEGAFTVCLGSPRISQGSFKGV